jgi:hypothetical protein
MSPASSDASMMAVAGPAPLRPTLLAVDSCTRQHANLLVPGQIVSGLVLAIACMIAWRHGVPGLLFMHDHEMHERNVRARTSYERDRGRLWDRAGQRLHDLVRIDRNK